MSLIFTCTLASFERFESRLPLSLVSLHGHRAGISLSSNSNILSFAFGMYPIYLHMSKDTNTDTGNKTLYGKITL